MAAGDVTLLWDTQANFAGLSSLDSLADATFTALSTELDVGAITKVTDILVSASITGDDGTPPTAGGKMHLYVAAPSDGTNYPTDTADYFYLGSVVLDAAGLVESNQFSVARAFGGVLPEKLKVAVENRSNGSTETTGNTVRYQAVYSNVE